MIFLRNSRLEKNCNSCRLYNAGAFRSEKEKKEILEKIEMGKEEYVYKVRPDDKIEEVARRETLPSDIGVVYQIYNGEGRNASTWCFLHIIDESGVRLTIKAVWSWRRMKIVGRPYSKENYRDTAERRREISSGLKEGDLDFVCRIEIVFRREEGDGGK